jgi:hypothetical protein
MINDHTNPLHEMHIFHDPEHRYFFVNHQGLSKNIPENVEITHIPGESNFINPIYIGIIKKIINPTNALKRTQYGYGLVHLSFTCVPGAKF